MLLGDEGLVDGIDEPAHLSLAALLLAAHSEKTAACERSSGRDQGLSHGLSLLSLLLGHWANRGHRRNRAAA